MPELLGQAQARRALQNNLSPRFRRLDRLERYVTGTQYEGRPSFHDQDCPLYDRAPSIVYPIVDSAIRSNVDLCLGEGRFPEFSSFVDEDDSAFDAELGLSEDDSRSLDQGVAVIVEQSRLSAAARECLRAAQACGTAVAIGSIRNGKVHIDTTKAKWCKPTFDTYRPDVVESLEIRYPYLQEYYDEREHKWRVRCMLYRRVIDGVSDVCFQPIQADEHGAEPPKGAWVRDDAKSLDHNLGFCPVVWYAFEAECTTVDEFDGRAVHRHMLEEIDALNFGLSQKHAAAMIAASPPTIEVGVEADWNPSAPGRSAALPMWLPGDPDSGRQWVSSTSGNTQPARKRGPGQIWRYESADAKVTQLTLPGDALKPIDDACRDLRSKIAEALSVVFTDFDNQRTTLDISGRALREQHKRQIERCDTIRDDFGTHFMLPMIDLLIRLCLGTPVEKLRVPGIDKILPILERFQVDVLLDTGETVQEWSPPKLELCWGDYFEPSEADQKAVIDAALVALNAGLITKRTAVERIADFYDIGNVDQYVDALEDEAAEKAEKALQNAQDMMKVAGPPQPPAPGQAKAAPPFGKPGAVTQPKPGAPS